MVKKEMLVNKDGKPYLTKKGEQLIEYTLEDGDIFVPQSTKPIVQTGKFVSYSMPVKLKDVNTGEKLDDIFIKLTETQANSLKKIDNIINVLFKAVKYENKFGTFIGFEYMDENKNWNKIVSNPPKTLEDFGL